MANINIEELDEETREKLGIRLPLPINQVGDTLIALGRIFRDLKGLSDEEALQVLQQAQMYIIERSIPKLQEENHGSYVPPMGWVIQVVARSFYLTPADLKQRSRTEEVAKARQVAMYLSRLLTACSLAEVGQALGGRTPATVSHGFQKVAERLDKNPSLKRKVFEIRTILEGVKEVTQ